jgi:hypothetical protein
MVGNCVPQLCNCWCLKNHEGQPVLTKSTKNYNEAKLGGGHTCDLSYLEGRTSVYEQTQTKMWDPNQKITKAKKGWGLVTLPNSSPKLKPQYHKKNLQLIPITSTVNRVKISRSIISYKWRCTEKGVFRFVDEVPLLPCLCTIFKHKVKAMIIHFHRIKFVKKKCTE